mmetsp:Transcript_30107/g.80578  ORF Transcript_30107/g.80578 Transcript_30107/m.80578 type:complete len:128 (-) Transcript_30107:1048-1431(-)
MVVECSALAGYKFIEGEIMPGCNVAGSTIFTVIYYIIVYVFTSAFPIFQLRHPTELGPRAFSGFVCYRLIANSVVVCLTASSFNDSEKVVSPEGALAIYFAGLGLTCVSLAATIASMEPDYYHTFFG